MARDSEITAAMARYPFMALEHEPMRDNLFVVEFDTSNIVFNSDEYRRFLMLRAQTFTIPGYAVSTKTDNFLNQATSYATGLQTQGSGLSFTVDFVDTYSPVNIMKLFSDWRRLIENLDDFTMNFNRFYITNFKVTVLNLDLTPYKAYLFYDVYPTKIPTITGFKYTTSPTFVKLSVTFNARMFQPITP